MRELLRELRARGYDAELVSVPFKWYPKEEILPHAAAWRLLDLSESNGRPIDLVIASKFPTYFVAAPEQGRVADPPVPRRLRAVRHAVQRLRPQRARRRPARHADPPRHRDARRVPARLRQRAEHRQPGRGNTTACGGSAVSSAAAGGAAGARASRPTATSCCRSAASNRSSGSTCWCRRWLGSINRSGWLWPGTAPSGRTSSGWPPRPGVADRVDVPRRGRRRAAARAVSRRARRPVSALRRGLRLRDARSVPVAQAGRSPRPTPAGRTSSSSTASTASCATPEAGGVRRRDQRARARSRGARRRSAMRDTIGRATITWDGVIEKLVQ